MIERFFLFQILDLLIKYRSPELGVFIYLIEILNSLDAKLSKQNTLDYITSSVILKLKEKLLVLVKDLAEKLNLADKSIFYTSYFESFESLKAEIL